MQIHELNTFSGTPSASDYLIIDDGTDTSKIPATAVGTDTTYPTATQAQITAGTSTTPSVVTPKLLHDFMLAIYPVGSIYMSVSSTSPATLFGGTWERIKDTFLLSAGNTYSAGATGGEATHKLTVDEMPSHTHAIYYYLSSGSKSFGYSFQDKGEPSSQTTPSGGIVNTGGSTAHNNMPPYLAVYVWKRTA